MPSPKQKKQLVPRRPRTKETFVSLTPRHRILLFLLTVSSLFLIYAIRQIPAPEPDHRATNINAYFTDKKAPLAGYGDTFVKAADLCGMDYRLLPAIAMQESTGGKRMKNNNPFGWGSAEIPFANFDEAIMEVGAHLCGLKPNTARWYGTTSTERKLYFYNGSVRFAYIAEVQWIMDQIGPKDGMKKISAQIVSGS